MGEHLRRLVDGDDLVAERDERMGDPPGAAAELKDGCPRAGGGVHDGRLAEIGQLRVEVDGTAVRRDHAGAGPVGARYLGHKPIVPNAATAPATAGARP